MENLTLSGGHTMQYLDDVSQNSTLETYNFVNQCQPNKFNLKSKQQNIEMTIKNYNRRREHQQNEFTDKSWEMEGSCNHANR